MVTRPRLRICSQRFRPEITILLREISDLRDEADELHGLLKSLDPADWQRPTLFKAWTVDDIMRHLHIGDQMGLASATDAAAFRTLMDDIRARRAESTSKVVEAKQRLNGLAGPELLDRWRETLDRLCAALAAKAPDARLVWAGPDMGVGMFTTARQMEIWAHGQAIYDLLGGERPAPAPRLRNIAEIGVRTFGWAYRNRGLTVPAVRPFIDLATPFGERWSWNTPSSDESVTGDALAFCQVVTQTRNVADTDLRISGPTARHWMSIAQCFAGPPETPPPPGSRYPSAPRSARRP
ncbi:MAG: TIGR03084 family metal-binding protein [Reyranellaceae bacterium]